MIMRSSVLGKGGKTGDNNDVIVVVVVPMLMR
jgi:hypothetical protein